MKIIIPYARNRIAYTVLRSLSKVAFCFPADSTRLAMARWSTDSAGSRCYPDPQKHQGLFVEWMKARHVEGYLIFPTFEESWILQRYGLFSNCLPPWPDIQEANNKWLITRRAERLGLLVPRSMFFQRAVAKPIVGRGSKGRTYLADMLIQDRVDGESVGVGMLWNHGKLKAACSWKRVAQCPSDGGWSAIGETITAPDEEATAEKLMASYNWTGPVMVEFKGKYIIEVNPRWWGSLGLSVAAGVDFPRLMLDLMLYGDCDECLTWKSGVRASYWAACLKQRIRPQGHSLDWRRSDPLPFLAQFALALKHGVSGKGFQLDTG